MESGQYRLHLAPRRQKERSHLLRRCRGLGGHDEFRCYPSSSSRASFSLPLRALHSFVAVLRQDGSDHNCRVQQCLAPDIEFAFRMV
jgi:hypothetical protein